MAQIINPSQQSSLSSSHLSSLQSSLTNDEELTRISTALKSEETKAYEKGHNAVTTADGWKHEVEAKGAFAGLIKGDVRVTAHDIKKEFHGDGWGAIVGIPAGVL